MRYICIVMELNALDGDTQIHRKTIMNTNLDITTIIWAILGFGAASIALEMGYFVIGTASATIL